MANKFLLLAKADYRKNRKKLGIFFTTLFLLLFVAYLDSGNFDLGEGVLLVTLQCIPIVTLILYALLSLSFGDYYGKGAVLNVMLPISNREKFTYIFVRNIVFISSVIFLIYIINHSIWETIFGKDYNLLVNHNFYYKANAITNCFIFFLSGILFKRLHALYGLMLICVVPIILMPILTKRVDSIVSILCDPGIIPSNIFGYHYREIAVIMINIGIVYWAWVKFKNLQIK